MTKKIIKKYGRLFLKHISKTKGCWVWNGNKNQTNYGVYSFRDPIEKKCYAHRFSYVMHKGPIPKGLQIDHLCRNRLCVNPKHLEAVTQRTNLLRGNTIPARNAKKTHCPAGHPYSGTNVARYTYRGITSRFCKQCRNNYKIKHKHLSRSSPSSKTSC